MRYLYLWEKSENLKLWNLGDTRSVKVFSANRKINFIKSLQFVSEQ